LAEENEKYVSVPLITIGDAAKYLGVTRNTLYQLIKKGEIRAVKRKNTVLVEQRSLDAFKAKRGMT
jgi:excisionase family DNA binding protein